MKKYLYTLVLAVLLLSSQQAFSGTYAGGTGILDDPFQIATAVHIEEMRVNSDDWDKHFIMTADIDLAGRVYSSAIIAPDTDAINYSSFIDIPFSGIFDGNGHVISNLTINTNGSGLDYIGLFGMVSGSGAEVKNLGIDNVKINAGNESFYVGGLMGGNNGTITNCYLNGTINGNMHTGGLVGVNIGTIINSYTGGEVSGARDTGGLVGRNYFGGIISKCYATSYVTANYINTGGHSDGFGGLIGSNYKADVSSCYATGDVEGGELVGGLIGSVSGGNIINNYAIGNVNGRDRIGGFIGDLWYGDITNNYATGDVSDGDNIGGFIGIMREGKTANNYSIGNVSGITNVGGFVGDLQYGNYSASHDGIVFNGCFWNIELNPTLRDIGSIGGHSDIMGRTTSEMYTQSTFTDYGWDFVGESANGIEDIWYISSCGGSYPTLPMQPVETVPEVTGLSKDEALTLIESLGISVIVKTTHGIIMPERHVTSQEPPAGCETAIVTLIISDGIAGSGSESDPYLIWSGWQMNAIANYPEDFDKHYILMADIDISAYTDDSFNIIGDLENNFTGVFDGNGHTITGLTYTSSEKDHIGLFGYLGQDAHIKNLGLIDVCIDAGIGNSIGSIAGRNKNGTISNCYAIGSVKSKWSIGGLVGINYGSILNCYTLGTIIGDQNTGGLVGVNVGSVINCYSAAFVSGRHRQGALIGYDKNGNYNASFWNSDINPNLPGVGPFANLAEVMGRTTFEMMTQNTFTDYGWEFVGEQTNGTEEIWWIEEGAGYPRLWWEYVKPLEPKELLEQLLQDVVAMELKQGIEKSLLVKLAAVFRKLGDDNKENDVAAINSLRAFTNEVKAQSGKSILAAKVDALIDTVEQIIELLQSLSNPVEEEASTRQSKIVTYKKISKAKQNIDTKPKKQQLRKTKYQVPKKQKVLPLQKHTIRNIPKTTQLELLKIA